jgi:hypothetical protein
MSKKDNGFEFREDFDEEVWDEEEWELFMQEADRRTEEYLKKFQDELLSKKESLDGDEDAYNVGEEGDERITDEEWRQSGSAWCDGEGVESYRNLAVWKTAFDFAAAVQRFIERSETAQRLSDEVQELYENCLVISAKIAGGHSMGYDREVLEGNIACCKRALRSAEDCVEALEAMRIRLNPTPEILRLYGLALETRDGVRDWIEQLRRRIWWR